MIGHRDKLTLMDFGIAKQLDSNSIVSRTGMLIGTPYYAAPEQFDSMKFGTVTPATDVYALGILLFQMLTNTLPFEGSRMSVGYAHCYNPLPELPDDIPKEIVSLVKKCTQKQPKDRYPDMTILQGAIDKILQAEAVEDYKELYAIYAGKKVNKQARKILEKHRKVLELSKEVTDLVEKELDEAERKRIVQERKKKEAQRKKREAEERERKRKKQEDEIPPPPPPPPPELPKEKIIKGIDLILVQGGTFTMGDNNGKYDKEKPEHKVTLDSFYIGKYQVTNEQYAKFLNEKKANEEDIEKWIKLSGSYGKEKCRIYKKGVNYEVEKGYENFPVIYVSWYGAKAFCDHYSFRLPTEAEWEYAARGGNKSKGYKYAGSDNIDEVAWYDGNSGGKTHPVNDNKKKPNELGIYHMSGNVWEWCEDWYDKNYYQYCKDNNIRENPVNTKNSSYRLLRGGSWSNGSVDVRVASRYAYDPALRLNDYGFRVVSALRT
jgi:formylglycine-generating enzyme required for sulfatase activity